MCALHDPLNVHLQGWDQQKGALTGAQLLILLKSKTKNKKRQFILMLF